MFYTKITRLLFNNGENLDINPNDIVVLVGPNNCGKSQSLKDIYNKIDPNGKSVVIQDVEISKGDLDELKRCIIEDSIVNHEGQDIYKGFQYYIPESVFHTYQLPKLNSSIRDFLVSFLTTEKRLSISVPPEVIDETDPKNHPLHYFTSNSDYQEKLSKYFNEAFGQELTPNFTARKKMTLCIGENQNISGGNFRDIHNRMSVILNSYPKLHEQGDGMRSFVGIILHMILHNYGLFLIDEPESFLHPPQARILGRVIGDLLGSERQAFIATHSEDIIKGLIEQCPDRIKVIRLTRENNTNYFSILNNNQFNSIWKDPLLRYSNIMDSLFHKNVVVCEADADCRLYSIFLDYLKTQQEQYSETLFIYSGSKNRMKPIIYALRSLSIDFRCIPDIDVLDQETIIRELFIACGGVWDEAIADNFYQFFSIIDGDKSPMSKTQIQSAVSAFFKAFPREEFTSVEVRTLKDSLKIDSLWKRLKSGGIENIPEGKARDAFDYLNDAFKRVNLFLVPVGELESFVPGVGGHGPGFVNNVMERYPNPEEPIYQNLKDFITSWGL